jgi:regulator of replication initiation timing
MSNPKAELAQQIENLEVRLADLKQQLQALEENNQHQAIENIDLHIASLGAEFDAIKAFWPTLMQELKTTTRT